MLNYVHWEGGTNTGTFTPTHALSALQLVSWVAAAVEASDGVEATLMTGAGLLTLVNIC